MHTRIDTARSVEPQGGVLFEGKARDAQHTTPLLELGNILVGCNNAHLVLEDGDWKVVGDPTEGALLAVGQKAGGDKQRLDAERPKHHEIPFDSDRKRRSVIRVMPDGRLRAFINGAPDELLRLRTQIYTEVGIRPITDDDRCCITAQNTSMAGRALRVLGSTFRDLDQSAPAQLTAESVERDLVFVGLTGMYDPPRAEAKVAVAKCHAVGIRVVMITGNHCTDDNFASIVAAVEEGRGIYDNIRKTLQYLLAGNCGELLLMTAAIVPALCLATDPIDRM